MKTFRGLVLSSTGAPVPSAVITVTDHYSGAAVALYEDDETTAITSLLSDASGAYAFKAEDGLFDIAINAPSYAVEKTIEAVSHTDGGPLLTLTCDEAGGIGYLKFAYLSGTDLCKLAKKSGTEAEAAADFICVTRGGRTVGQVGAFRCPGGSFGGLSGGTAGATCYLGDAGGVTTTEPSGGDNVTMLGKFITTTRINYTAPGGGGIQSVTVGDGLAVDVTDPANPVISVGTGVGVWKSIVYDAAVLNALPVASGGGTKPNHILLLDTLTIPAGYFVRQFLLDIEQTPDSTNVSVTTLSCTVGTAANGSNTNSGLVQTNVMNPAFLGYRTHGGVISNTQTIFPRNASFNWYIYFQSSGVNMQTWTTGRFTIWYELVRLF